MKPLKRLFFFLGVFLYAQLLLASFLGAMAPWLSVNFLPFVQLIPAFLLYLTPLFLLGGFLFRKSHLLLGASLLAVVLGLWIGQRDYAWNQPPEAEASETDLRLISYNIRNFGFSGDSIARVASILKPLQPDVICFQEFRNYESQTDGPRALEVLGESLNLPYRRHFRTRNFYQGVAFFSRYPILGVDTLFMDPEEANNGLLVTLDHPHGNIGVGNVHLSSFQFTSLLPEENAFVSRVRRVFRNTAEKVPLHQEHIDSVFHQLDTYPHPLVLATDLNTAPHTRIAHQLRRRFTDSFRAAGRDWGHTFPLIGPMSVRIDYQWYTPELRALRHRVLPVNASDHFPVVVDYKIRD